MNRLSLRGIMKDFNSSNGAVQLSRTLKLSLLEVVSSIKLIWSNISLHTRYLARVVFQKDSLLYPDSVVGTDSHTTMINGLGVLGWGVGGIEAEANMLGETTSLVLPQVVGFKFIG